jgi:hypothetical protein
VSVHFDANTSENIENAAMVVSGAATSTAAATRDPFRQQTTRRKQRYQERGLLFEAVKCVLCTMILADINLV